jgi:alpha-ketoglutarate-dependent taurine dioxygenase
MAEKFHPEACGLKLLAGPMLTHPIHGPRAWRATSLDEPSAWYYPLSERCRAVLDEAVRRFGPEPQITTELSLPAAQAACLTDELGSVRAALERGRGFAIIEGLPCHQYTCAQQQVFYWLVGQGLGSPMEQNVQGTLLYDVRDTGQDVRTGARYSVTNAETGFHTDNSFGETVLDYVGLLCIQPAKSGGHNRVVSMYSAHNQLLAHHADMLPTLYHPFHIDRRGGLRPGDSCTIRRPILEWKAQELVCRYLRYWIEAGHEKAAQPLTAAQKEALDVLDEVLKDPELHAEMTLRPGEMFFINNRWLLHTRSAFEEHPEPERRRHYVRLWLRA